MMIRIVWGVLVALFLVGCAAESQPLPTSAPVIPPTRTATPSPPPEVSLARPLQTQPPTTPTVDVFQLTHQAIPTQPPRASWTPTATHTSAPTQTPRPTNTPLPSNTPLAQLRDGIETLPDGTQRLLVSAERLTDALATTPFTPHIEIEADGMWFVLHIENAFLGQTSHVRARVNATLEGQRVVLQLAHFDLLEGPRVTREQIQAALDVLASPFWAAILPTDLELEERGNLRFNYLSGWLALEPSTPS